MRYGDLPKINDPTIVVLEKSVPGVRELAGEEEFGQKLQFFDDKKK